MYIISSNYLVLLSRSYVFIGIVRERIKYIIKYIIKFLYFRILYFEIGRIIVLER